MVDKSNKMRKPRTEEQTSNHNFAKDLAYDFGGAILFSFPLLMTMEMWWLGFYMDRLRLALFLFWALLIVLALSYLEGGEETFKIEVLDALVACSTGYTVATVMLFLLGIIKPGMSLDEIIGKIALHAIPCSIGAILARRQLEAEETKKKAQRREGYHAKLFLMGVGAIFLAFQLAPTEEIILIGYMMTEVHATLLILVSLCMMQAFLSSIERRPQVSIFAAGFFWNVFLRFTIVGYAVALLLSFYVLWTFGRVDGIVALDIVKATLVLGFPAALGAATARLIYEGGRVRVTKSSGKENEKIQDAPLWMWGIALLGLVLVLGSIMFMIYEAVTGDTSPPDVLVQVEFIEDSGSGFLVMFRTINEGGSTAAGLTIEGTLMNGTENVETSNTTIEYLPSHSERKGGLFFTLDPRQYDLELRATGYEEP